METATTAINITAILSQLLCERDSPGKIILFQTANATMQTALLEQLEQSKALCATTHHEYTGAQATMLMNKNQQISYALLNPTEWEEWATGEISFSNENNVTTFIIDNSFTATCMADETWCINKDGDTKKLVSTCFF